MADFKEVRDETGKLVKMKADISNFKSLTVNEYNKASYCHICDVSKCFKKGGGFDISKSKTVTLKRDDVNNFVKMIGQVPAAMDKILSESKNDSISNASNDSSSDDAKKSLKFKKITRKRKPNTHKRKTHEVFDQSESSSEPEVEKGSKIRNNKSKKQRAHPYSSAQSVLQSPDKTSRPKHERKATKGIFKNKKHSESGSDTEVFTD